MSRAFLFPAALAVVSACTFDATGLTVGPSQVSYFGEDSSSDPTSFYPTTGADTPSETSITGEPIPDGELSTSSTDETTEPLPTVCGDGVVASDEECDDGFDENADDHTCTSTCRLARCGDGLLQPANGEVCDDGDANAEDPGYGGCSQRCLRGPHCGDGKVQGLDGEECEPLAGDQRTTCLSTCVYEARILFMTSVATSGNLGGLGGADHLCNKLAAAGQLPGNYRAWLVTEKATLPYRIPELFALKTPVKFVNVHGDVLADHVTDLALFGPDHPVVYDEHGEARPEQYVWTNLTRFGSSGEDCDQWTGTSGYARVGYSGYLPDEGPAAQTWHEEEQWTDLTIDVLCSDATPHLYCIQVTL